MGQERPAPPTFLHRARRDRPDVGPDPVHEAGPVQEVGTDPLVELIGGTSETPLDIDLTGEWAQTVEDIEEAIVHYLRVRRQCPRRWQQIGPEHRRSLTALVSAVEAIHVAIRTASYYAPLPALKAGAGWQELASATGDGTGDDYRQVYLRHVQDVSWPDSLAEEIVRLLQEDAE